MKNPNGYGCIKHGHILLGISTFFSGIRAVGHIG